MKRHIMSGSVPKPEQDADLLMIECPFETLRPILVPNLKYLPTGLLQADAMSQPIAERIVCVCGRMDSMACLGTSTAIQLMCRGG